jgi:hypothetical protein
MSDGDTGISEGPIEKRTVREVATMMGVCERTVTNWRKQGLRVVKIGRKCWILLRDLQQFIEDHRSGQKG